MFHQATPLFEFCLLSVNDGVAKSVWETFGTTFGIIQISLNYKHDMFLYTLVPYFVLE